MNSSLFLGLLAALLLTITVEGFRCGMTQLRGTQSLFVQMRENDDISESGPDKVQMQAPEPDKMDVGTYVFGKPGELRKDASKAGIDPVRFISYNLLAVALALGANFLGVTSLLMSNSNPDYFRSIGLDQLYETGGYRRYSSPEQKYQFMYPSTWNKIALFYHEAEIGRNAGCNEEICREYRIDAALGPVRALSLLQ